MIKPLVSCGRDVPSAPEDNTFTLYRDGIRMAMALDTTEATFNGLKKNLEMGRLVGDWYDARLYQGVLLAGCFVQ